MRCSTMDDHDSGDRLGLGKLLGPPPSSFSFFFFLWTCGSTSNSIPFSFPTFVISHWIYPGDDIGIRSIVGGGTCSSSSSADSRIRTGRSICNFGGAPPTTLEMQKVSSCTCRTGQYHCPYSWSRTERIPVQETQCYSQRLSGKQTGNAVCFPSPPPPHTLFIIVSFFLTPKQIVTCNHLHLVLLMITRTK